MKSKKFAVLLFTLILALGLFPMSVFAAQRAVDADSTASITVENAVKDDVLAAYKLINITYNSTTNTLAYEWSSQAIKDYFENGTTNGTGIVYDVKKFAALADNSDALKTLLSGLPNYIANNSIAPVGTKTVGADKTATFADLAMGEYFIRPTSSTSVYQLMLQKIEPTVDDTTNKYVISDLAFTAKHEEVTIEKTADKTSVTKGEKVAYTVTVDIPTYSAEATDKTFSVSDLLPDGLSLNTTSIEVKVDGTAVDTAAYTLDTTATAEYTFKVSVETANYDTYWASNSGKQLVITYTATLKDDNTTAVNVKETNKATFEYSNYPYVENSHNKKTASVDVTTFAIKIDKYKDSDKNVKLKGAKFDLYRTATQAEITAGSGIVTIPLTDIQGIKLEGDKVTGENGSVSFEKYEANDNKYDYYLVETKAPSGYNILADAVKVNFTDADVKATNGVYTVEVPNSSGITLPITGGEGIVLFSVIGIVFMGGAVFLFIMTRKKAKANDKK